MFVPEEPQLFSSGTQGDLPTKWAGLEAVDGTAGHWLTAALGSEYTRIEAGNVSKYIKTASAGATADWQEIVTGA